MEAVQQKNWLASQLFSNWKRFEIIYVIALILLQVVVYLIAPDSMIGMISGIAGVLCLVFGMKGRKITFIFGIVQTLGMAYIAWISHAYGAFIMGLIYVISQPIGWVMWGKDEATHSLKPQIKNLLFAGSFIAWLIGWFVLAQVHGQLPYFDSINFVVSMIAQVLYILKYKENWSLWIIVNIANLLYWCALVYQDLTGKTSSGSLGASMSQVALNFALLFNSIYANKVWANGEADYEGGIDKELAQNPEHEEQLISPK
ncbi:MAG: nicotinamide riboside transporter PnuC [Micrococcaceae bacterium]